MFLYPALLLSLCHDVLAAALIINKEIRRFTSAVKKFKCDFIKIKRLLKHILRSEKVNCKIVMRDIYFNNPNYFSTCCSACAFACAFVFVWVGYACVFVYKDMFTRLRDFVRPPCYHRVLSADTLIIEQMVQVSEQPSDFSKVQSLLLNNGSFLQRAARHLLAFAGERSGFFVAKMGLLAA